MRLAAFIFFALTAGNIAVAQPLPASVLVHDRAARAVDVWISSLPRIERSYATLEGPVVVTGWTNRGFPVAISERRDRGMLGDVAGTFYFDGRDLIRYREEGQQSFPQRGAGLRPFSLTVDFSRGRMVASRKIVDGQPVAPDLAEIDAIPAAALALIARLGAPRQSVAPPAPVSASPSKPLPSGGRAGAFGLLAPVTGPHPQPDDYRRPRSTQAEWLQHVGTLLPAVTHCLDWYGNRMQVAQVWPLEGGRAGVRMVDADGGRVDCVAMRDGSRGWLLAALSPDTPLGPGEGQALFTPTGRAPPAGPCFASQPLSSGGSEQGIVTTRRC
jgi:hypothetical protein